MSNETFEIQLKQEDEMDHQKHLIGRCKRYATLT